MSRKLDTNTNTPFAIATRQNEFDFDRLIAKQIVIRGSVVGSSSCSHTEKILIAVGYDWLTQWDGTRPRGTWDPVKRIVHARLPKIHRGILPQGSTIRVTIERNLLSRVGFGWPTQPSPLSFRWGNKRQTKQAWLDFPNSVGFIWILFLFFFFIVHVSEINHLIMEGHRDIWI